MLTYCKDFSGSGHFFTCCRSAVGDTMVSRVYKENCSSVFYGEHLFKWVSYFHFTCFTFFSERIFVIYRKLEIMMISSSRAPLSTGQVLSTF